MMDSAMGCGKQGQGQSIGFVAYLVRFLRQSEFFFLVRSILLSVFRLFLLLDNSKARL